MLYIKLLIQIDLFQIADEQNNDEEPQNFIFNAPPSLNLSRCETLGSIRTIWCDIPSQCNRVLVPAYLTKQVFDFIHSQFSSYWWASHSSFYSTALFLAKHETANNTLC